MLVVVAVGGYMALLVSEHRASDKVGML